MTRLASLRRRLRQLRRLRRLARWTIAACGAGTALLWVLAACFLADYCLRMGRLERAVLLALAATVLVWAVRRFAVAWLGPREDELDMALLIERQQHIDTDLIAALEFESPEAPRWGSVQLEQAVIEQTAQAAARLQPEPELPRTPLVRRLVAAGITGAVLAGLVAAFPDHARVFLARLALGTARYPTATRIEHVRINQHAVDLVDPPAAVRCPYGQPVRFEVRGAGKLPPAGSVRLDGPRGAATSVVLERVAEDSATYRGELARLVDPAVCRFSLGDAWTEPVAIELVTPPTVELQLEVTPPDYAHAPREVLRDVRQFAVVEGSRVELRLVSDKPLAAATVTFDSTRLAMRRLAQAPGEHAEVWLLPERGSPLAQVVEPVRYAVDVTDADGLCLERPIEGLVRIKPDYPPQLTAAAVTQSVLPSARPSIAWSASDDYGLARVALVPVIVHADGTEEERPELVVYAFPGSGPPPKSLQQQTFVFPLAPLGATKGDQIKVALCATDFRGTTGRGKSAWSDPLLFQVTDEQGILAALAEQERQSLRHVETMIQTQISVGESP